MTIEEIKQQLDFLSDKIDLINANLQFNITTFLAVLAIAIALTGTALVLLVKNIVNKRVNDELKKISEDRDKKIKEATDKIDKRISNKNELLGYEEGEWIPKLQIYGVPDRYYPINTGKGTYVKQGNIININIYISLQISDEFRNSVKDMSDYGRIIIDGFPFVASPYMYRSCSIGICEGINIDNGQLVAEIIPLQDNPTQIQFGLVNKDRLKFLTIKDLSEYVIIKVSGIYSIK
ncbi:hypothetical protein U728_1237 [Clostridium botulinum 202F]|nr:hypothetical protein U728_1237 [Clostridium botulinum 202F]KAI3346989.1 hypothetical protein CIT17_08445 [Clostridium botulinum]KON13673.1 hypothetical protein ACP50_06315 [Clostridium botulinum]MBY6987220.1 hypothetical protein [Clostridium botulinum]NFG99660.1 hypothetical protein [Clostridium botulinum]